MNLKDLMRKTLENYKPYTYGEQPNPEEKWVKLNTNENPYTPPEAVLDDIKAAVNDKLRLYPDPLCKELRGLLSTKFFADHSGIVKPENILVANGSDEILDILFKAFIDPGDEVVVFKPSYGMYPALNDLYGGKLVEYTLTNDFKIPESVFDAKGKLLFVCTPNNPDGLSASNELISKICENFNGLVIADEAYANFTDKTAVPLIEKHKNLAIMRTFSKGYSFASERIGFIVAHPEVIQMMVDVKLPYNVTYLSQVAAISVVNHLDDYQKIIDAIVSERNRLMKELSGEHVTVFKSDSNFVFIKLPSKIIADNVYNALKDNKILIRRYSKPELTEYLRITVGTPEDNNRFLKVFNSALKNNF